MARAKKPAFYEVSGSCRVLGHDPGDAFEAALDSVMEERLIRARAIRRVPKPEAPEGPQDAVTADETEGDTGQPSAYEPDKE